VFFATKIVIDNGKPILTATGKSVTSLRKSIAEAAGAKVSNLNIEALAATPERGLLIGLRSPLREVDGVRRAIVVPFKNPAAVVDEGADRTSALRAARRVKVRMYPGRKGSMLVFGICHRDCR
jgi:hypothetical protein